MLAVAVPVVVLDQLLHWLQWEDFLQLLKIFAVNLQKKVRKHIQSWELNLQSVSEIFLLLEAPGVGEGDELGEIRLGGGQVQLVPGEEGQGLLGVVLLVTALVQVALHLC